MQQLWKTETLFMIQTVIYTALTVGDGFGLSLAVNVSGNTLVIGAPYTTVDSNVNAGQVSVYRKNNAGIRSTP